MIPPFSSPLGRHLHAIPMAAKAKPQTLTAPAEITR